MAVKEVLCSVILASIVGVLHAEQVYQKPEEFLSHAFGAKPETRHLILKGDLAADVKSILGHRYGKLRVPYWQQDCRSVWILEEIGKERPITTGFVVSPQGLEKVKVLVFRESRGWEVKHDYFSRQFTHAKLNSHKLDRRIDNISGATLSVRAVTNISRMALLLHNHVTENSC